MGSLIPGPAPQPHKGCIPPNSLLSDLYDLHWIKPLRPAQACTISALPGHAPQACQAGDSQTFMISAALYPSGSHRPAQSLPDLAPKAYQAGNTQTCMISTRPCSLGLHRPAQSLLGHTPQACKPGDHRHSSSPLGCAPHACTGLHDLYLDCAPKAYQAINPQACTIFTLPEPHSSGMPGKCSKG
jgi:hypothetical protein